MLCPYCETKLPIAVLTGKIILLDDSVYFKMFCHWCNKELTFKSSVNFVEKEEA